MLLLEHCLVVYVGERNVWRDLIGRHEVMWQTVQRRAANLVSWVERTISQIFLYQLTDMWCAQVWYCEFCEERNVIDILPEEIPKLADVTYMLKPAPATTATSCGGVDESLFVFCVDISGSMCVSQQVCSCLSLLCCFPLITWCVHVKLIIRSPL